jgi:TolB protein
MLMSSSFFRLFMLFALAGIAWPALAGAPGPNGGWDAAWSPDGQLLAFTSGSRHGVPNLWVLEATGKAKPRQLTIRGAHQPQWIPGTRIIAFGTVRTGTPTFMAIEADGAPDSERPIPNLPARAEDVRWSPNGALFAYGQTTVEGSARNLCFGRAQGGGASELTKNFWVREWSWTPDGSMLAFVVGKATGTSLWTVSLQDKNVDLLYRGYCGAPAYSPDGNSLALAIPDVKSGFTIEVVELATRTGKRLTLETFDGRHILWSPDGKTLYFAAGRKHEPSIWRIGADGEGLTRLTPEGVTASGPALSPNGQRLAYSAMKKRSYGPELFVSDVAGTPGRQLTATKPSRWSPVWSPDGRRIIYQTDVNHRIGLFQKRLVGSGAQRIAEFAGINNAEVLWIPGTERLLISAGGRLLTVGVFSRNKRAIPVPNLNMPVQDPFLDADEIIFTEWFGRMARISAIKHDGAGKRIVTNQPSPPAPKPEETPQENESDTGRIDTRSKIAGGQYIFAQYSGGQPGDEAPAEMGNPHSGLGVMGPQLDVNSMKTPPAVDLAPAISPDRKRIAFARQGLIWLVNSDGTDERQLTEFAPAGNAEKRLVSAPAWAPQGETLLFLSLRTHAEGMMLEIWCSGTQAGSAQTVYTEQVGSEYGYFYLSCTNPPVFTPDGTRILFTSIAAGVPRIATIGLDGGDLLELAPSPSVFPVLDPTGRKLAYVDLSDTQERVRVRDLRTGKVTKIP